MSEKETGTEEVRDPRIDPIPGDVVSGRQGIFRLVDKVDHGNIYYQKRNTKGEWIKVARPSWISTWREWCRGGEVHETA